jgi:uncharacterized metal-binding protein YceD (DUF177 family)
MPNESLKLRLAALPAGHSEMEGDLRFSVLDAAEEEEPYEVAVRCEIDQLGPRVHLRCRVRGQARSGCHRCLEPFRRPVDTEFQLTLQKGLEVAGDEDLVSVPENAVEFDLAPHVREAVVLEEPIQLLCRPDCRGLCPRCGADLNQVACGCAPLVDERWAPLGDLPRSPEF